MNKIKSLVLGSAATLAAIGGAQAADLPVKAKAVEYVKVCSLYGAGFYYIPGSDTCIRIGGYLRAEVTVGAGASHTPYTNGTGALDNRLSNDSNTRGRIMVTFDTRTATEYGVVRAFGAFAPQWSTGDGQGAGGMRVESAFIQFAGFTFGHSASAYAFPWNANPGNLSSGLFGGPNFDAGVNNIQYTWQFGAGVSASIGVDEAGPANRTQILNGGLAISAIGNYTNAYGGTNAPDVVGNIKFDQAWGSLQFSGAGHQVYSTYYGNGNEANGHPDDKWGYAFSAALQLKNLPTGPGDDIKITGTYTEGAIRYLLGQSGSTPTGIAQFGAQSLSLAPMVDAVYGATGSSLQLTKGWGINGAFNHNWNANWVSSVFGSYSHVDYNSSASAIFCQGFMANAGTAGINCNPDFNISQVGFLTTWKPVKNLALSGEVMWTNYDTKTTGTTGATFNPGSGKAVGSYDLKSQDVFSGIFRVQRNF